MMASGVMGKDGLIAVHKRRRLGRGPQNRVLTRDPNRLFHTAIGCFVARMVKIQFATSSAKIFDKERFRRFCRPPTYPDFSGSPENRLLPRFHEICVA